MLCSAVLLPPQSESARTSPCYEIRSLRAYDQTVVPFSKPGLVSSNLYPVCLMCEQSNTNIALASIKRDIMVGMSSNVSGEYQVSSQCQ